METHSAMHIQNPDPPVEKFFFIALRKHLMSSLGWWLLQTKNHFNHIRMFARAFWSWAQLLVSRQKRICNFWLHKSTRPCACHNIPYFTTWQHGIRFKESVDLLMYPPFSNNFITIIIETFASVHSYLLHIAWLLAKVEESVKTDISDSHSFMFVEEWRWNFKLPNALGKYVLRHFWFF